MVVPVAEAGLWFSIQSRPRSDSALRRPWAADAARRARESRDGFCGEVAVMMLDPSVRDGARPRFIPLGR